MLTPQDDLMGHQTPGTFAQAGNNDQRFTERYWYTGHPIDGQELLIDVGMGLYPNRGVMDGFAGITIGRKQYNFRVSRRLGKTPLDTTIGPLSFQVIKGMHQHRVALGENESGLSFELIFDATFPGAQEKQSYRERDGAVQEDLARVAQFGRWTGWIIAQGVRYEVKPENWWGQRDHSWGIRSQMCTDPEQPPVQVHRNFLWNWSMLQFQDSSVSIFLKERSPEQPMYVSGGEFRRLEDGSVQHREVVAVRHDIIWEDDPLGQTIRSADFHFEFERGPARTVHMEATPTRFYLKAGMYGGLKGWQQGDDKGEFYSEHDVWDLDSAADRELARTLGDHVFRLSSEGETGIGISEYGVAPGYPLYEIPQKHPAM